MGLTDNAEVRSAVTVFSSMTVTVFLSMIMRKIRELSGFKELHELEWEWRRMILRVMINKVLVEVLGYQLGDRRDGWWRQMKPYICVDLCDWWW